jgi:predicted Zn-dependent protease
MQDRHWSFRAVLVALMAGTLLACGQETGSTQATENQSNGNAAAPAQEAGQAKDQETQIGDEIFKELTDKAEIIAKTPLYDPLQSVTGPIASVAGRHYEHPFNFILVHEAQPNAFSVPGGNVFVVDSLMTFVKNREELTGVLCHEVAHTLHRDSMKKIEEDKKLTAQSAGALILLGPSLAHALAIKMLAELRSNGYSRDQESAADIAGSDICAAAGYNPYGMIWLFQDFQNADPNEVPQLLSDHPSFENRISALQEHFQQNPGVFGKFSADRKSATAFSVPQDAWVIFKRK